MPVTHPNKTAIVTIVSNNYLHFARTMLQSAKRHHPDYAFYCVIVDRDLSHALALSTEFETIPIAKLNLPLGEEFLFQYNILELNTAVKPWAIEYLFARGHDNVFYVDPDIFFYARMTDVEQMLSTDTDIVITPHLLAPVTDDKQPRELDIRRAGTYNFGFCALRESTNTRKFLRWWQNKLTRDCVNDPDRGLFVDQSWIDLVPGLFDNVGILRHKGYNVAYWNIAQRPLTKRDANRYFVDDDPLVFFHFSGLDPSNPDAFSKHQTRFTLSTVGPAKDVVNAYVSTVMTNGYSKYANLEYSFGTFSSGEKIPDIFRKLYRQSSALRERMGSQPNGASLRTMPNADEARSPEAARRIPGSSPEVKADFSESTALLPGYSRRKIGPAGPGPFDCASALCDPWPDISFEGVAPTNAMMALWNVRHDVQSEFPLNSAGSIIAYYKWFIVFPPGVQHYSASVISHHAASVKCFDEQAKAQAQASVKTVKAMAWLGHEQRVHHLYKYLLSRTPDPGGFLVYSEMCKTDSGFVRAWGEIGLSEESKKKRFLWMRMFVALLTSIFWTSQRTLAIADQRTPAQAELIIKQPIAGMFPAEADSATAGVWVTDMVATPINARPGDAIRLEGIYFPELIEKQTGGRESTIRVLLDDEEIYSTQLKVHGDFMIECLVPTSRAAGPTKLTVESNKVFVPKSIGQGNDERKLAWRMRLLLTGDNRAFDCAQEASFVIAAGGASANASDAQTQEIVKLAYSGFFQADLDSIDWGVWASANVVVPIVPVPGESIRLRGTYSPTSMAKQTGNGESTLRFYVGVNQIHSAILRAEGEFAIDFVLPELANGDCARLHIKCSNSFVKKDIGEGDDDRLLSWRIRTLMAGRIIVFDCARQNIATSDRRFVPRMRHFPDFSSAKVKLFALYFAQFSPFPKDCAWPSSQTVDWADVTNANSQYEDHHQPHIPVELGFYDYRTAGVLKRQVALARQYGISGFCFYHRWTCSKRLTDQPLDRVLADPSLDIEYCVCLAIELLEQQQDDALKTLPPSSKHDFAIINSLAPAFTDVRYRRIDQKPILIVSNAAILPNAAKTVARWREIASQLGLHGLYLIADARDNSIDFRVYGFDAIVALSPVARVDPMDATIRNIRFAHPSFSGQVYDYRKLAECQIDFAMPGLTNFEAVMPSWDNEPSAPGAGISYVGASPEEYAKWLSRATAATFEKRKEEQLLFINGWNAWGAGAHLEPDQRHGYGYLHATASVLLNFPNAKTEQAISELNASFMKRHDAVVILHVYYEDLIDSIFDSFLTAVQSHCDLIVSVMYSVSLESLIKIKDKFENCFIFQAENRGRDIRPFIIALRKAHDLGYLLGCKVHSKKSLQLQQGDEWRTNLFESLLRSPSHVGKILQRFNREPTLGLLVSDRTLFDLSDPAKHFGNTEWLNKLLARMGEEEKIGKYKFRFPAGSMFWFRMIAMPQLLDDSFVSLEEFELEAGQLDETLGHAIERIIGLIPTHNQFEIDSLPFHFD